LHCLAVDKLIGTVIIERTIDLLSVLLFLIVIILTSKTLINKFLKESIFMPLREKALSVINLPWIFWALLAFFAVAALYLMIRYRKSLRKFRFFSKMFDIAKGVITGLKTITNLNRKWEFIFLTISIWVSYAIMTWVVVFCLKSTSDITFWNSLIILVVGGLAMSVPVQAGFGAFHWAVSQVLIVMHGISREDGLTYAILSHESQIIFEILVGLISIYIMYGRNRKDKTADKV